MSEQTIATTDGLGRYASRTLAGRSSGSFLRSAAEKASVVIRFALAVIFVYAAVSKIERPYAFLETVYGYRMLPSWAAVFLVMTLPWIELAVGVLLFAGIALRGCFLCAAGMAVMFMAAQLYVLYRGMNISCGCFGDASQVGAASVARTAGLLLLAVGAFVYTKHKRASAEL